MTNFQKLWLSLILRVARHIWQILQISAVICRILRIPPGSANCKPKFLSKKLAKVFSQKILQSRTFSSGFSVMMVVMVGSQGLWLFLLR